MEWRLFVDKFLFYRIKTVSQELFFKFQVGWGRSLHLVRITIGRTKSRHARAGRLHGLAVTPGG